MLSPNNHSKIEKYLFQILIELALLHNFHLHSSSNAFACYIQVDLS